MTKRDYIEVYRVVNNQDQPWAGPFTDPDEAIEYANDERHRTGEHFAVISEIFEYTDSELCYATNGADTWPPEKEKE